jgi:putative membrane protein
MSISRREPWILLALVAVALVVSGIEPHERGTWLLEVAPVLIGVPLLLATGRRFPLTPLVYRLIFLHALILILGGHYTYARVPLGFWLQDLLDLSRNHYDRLGHLAQGFIPAILAREVLLRTSPLRQGRWLFALVTSICLAFSAFYELIEWWAAVIDGAGADPGRRLGHPVGHVPGVDRRPGGTAAARPGPRSSARAAAGLTSGSSAAPSRLA